MGKKKICFNMDRGLKILQSILITVVFHTLTVAKSESVISFADPPVLPVTLADSPIVPASPAVPTSPELPWQSPSQYSFPPDLPSSPAVLPLPDTPPPHSLPPEQPASPAVVPLPDPTAPAPQSLPPEIPGKPSLRARRRRNPGIRAAYWPSFDSFPASKIDTSYFTHIYYAFLLPSPTTYELNLTSLDLVKLPELTHALQNKTPRAKALLSIGGAGNDPKVFSAIAGSSAARGVFIKSAIDVARKYGFDGVDLDWEFPADDADMSNLATLFAEWKRGLVRESLATKKPRLLLSSAVYFAAGFLFDEPRSYPAKAMAKYLDWISPMCFDYHGSWDNFTGLHSALYDPNSNISTVHGIGSWIGSGVPKEKLVMGLPLYGRSWKLEDPRVNGIGAPAVGVGPGDEGTMVYYEVVEFNRRNKTVVVYDENAASFYSYAGDSWVGYDDVASIRLKVRFARGLGLGGYFFWALGQDKGWTLSREASNTWNKW